MIVTNNTFPICSFIKSKFLNFLNILFKSKNAFLDLQQNTNYHQNDSLDFCLLGFRLFLEMGVYY